MYLIIFRLFWVFFTCILVIRPVYSEETAIKRQFYHYSHGLVTVHVKDMPLHHILRELCNQADIQLTLKGQLSTKINVSFDKLPLKQAIQRLAGNRTLVMIHADDVGNSSNVVEEIRIYERYEANAVDTKKYISPEVQEELEWVHYLATRPEDEAVTGLGEILYAKDKNLVVKEHAIEILTNFTDNQVADALANGLSDERYNVRAGVVRALGQLDNEQSSFILAQVLFGDSDNEMRLLAVRQLAAYRTSAAKAFLQAATKDQDELVQIEAQYALDAFGFN